MTLAHGYSKYVHEKCRCAICATASKDYHRDYYAELRRLAQIGREVERVVKGTKA